MPRNLTVKEAIVEAKKSLKKKDYSHAENLFKLILEADPNNFSAKRGLETAKRKASNSGRLNAKGSSSSRVPEGLADQCLKEFNSGNYVSAEKLCEKALKNGESVEISNIQGVVLHYLGKFDLAIQAFQRGIEFQPDYANTWGNMACTLEVLGRYQEGLDAARRAIDLNSETASSYNNLASNLRGLGRGREAVNSLERALELNPNLAEAHNNLGNNWGDLGDLKRALHSYEEAIRLSPDFHIAFSNLLFTSSQISEITPEINLLRAKNFGTIVEKKVKKMYRHENRKINSKIRVGFVSGDLRNHPVGYFLEAFIKYIDYSKVDFFAYPSSGNEDELTERIRSYFSAWRPIFGLSDEDAASIVFGDKIDVLFDLSGHTAFNRLSLFAWKPSPIQVSWGGYFATTGVKEMDYILGNWEVIPSSEEDHFVEKVVRLPNNYFCFAEPNLNIEVKNLPAFERGYVTFGCFNSLIKINSDVVLTWANILLSVPRSRLFLKTKQLETVEEREAISQRFHKNGIGPERLILEGPSSREDLLDSYNKVDIGLDTFPYPGGATTAEALWMGVPVVTMKGSYFLSHVGESVITAAGFPEWITSNEDAYMRKVLDLSSGLEVLAQTRSGLRKKVVKSPLFDGPLFADNFLKAIYSMSKVPKD